jgi:hypothetical protein
MASCRSCSRDLDPSWKFCVHCGTAVRSVDAAAPASVAPPAPAPLVSAPESAPASVAPVGPAFASSTATAVASPAPTSLGTPASPDAAPVWTSAEPSTWPGAPLRPASPASVPAAIRPESAEAAPPEFSVLAIVGFALALVGFAPAFVLGHLALARIRAHGLRGAGLAVAAIVLGYVFLALWITAGVLVAVTLLRA